MHFSLSVLLASVFALGALGALLEGPLQARRGKIHEIGGLIQKYDYFDFCDNLVGKRYRTVETVTRTSKVPTTVVVSTEVPKTVYKGVELVTVKTKRHIEWERTTVYDVTTKSEIVATTTTTICPQQNRRAFADYIIRRGLGDTPIPKRLQSYERFEVFVACKKFRRVYGTQTVTTTSTTKFPTITQVIPKYTGIPTTVAMVKKVTAHEHVTSTRTRTKTSTVVERVTSTLILSPPEVCR